MDIQIKTKYNIGDQLYCINKEIQSFTIVEISVKTSLKKSTDSPESIITYDLQENNVKVIIAKKEPDVDKEFFTSKDELIKHLIDKCNTKNTPSDCPSFDYSIQRVSFRDLINDSISNYKKACNELTDLFLKKHKLFELDNENGWWANQEEGTILFNGHYIFSIDDIITDLTEDTEPIKAFQYFDYWIHRKEKLPLNYKTWLETH